jgi:hypothetical protein
MIATSRKSGSPPTISRRYEFTRLHDQTLASAYEALIPVVSRRTDCKPSRADDQELTGVHRSPHCTAAGG